jgi:hypothetical protein
MPACVSPRVPAAAHVAHHGVPHLTTRSAVLVFSLSLRRRSTPVPRPGPCATPPPACPKPWHPPSPSQCCSCSCECCEEGGWGRTCCTWLLATRCCIASLSLLDAVSMGFTSLALAIALCLPLNPFIHHIAFAGFGFLVVVYSALGLFCARRRKFSCRGKSCSTRGRSESCVYPVVRPRFLRCWGSPPPPNNTPYHTTVCRPAQRPTVTLEGSLGLACACVRPHCCLCWVVAPASRSPCPGLWLLVL